ncbi:group II intron maturase-specific domain-containing protein [Bradyrhizobium sp. RT5a]|uniref:group II intron maturase-specific domain-containing protein n=1 Tax=unclassified Bradyrhizobium TaxID=2631580 RepID=UPI00339A02D6
MTGASDALRRKALDKFKDRIREITCRTRGISLRQMIADLTPYLIGWRGYFGFCQAPRVLTNLEAWIRRRLRLYLWRQWRNGHNRFTELRRLGIAESPHRSLPVHRRDSGVCPDTRRFNTPYEIMCSTPLVSPESSCLCRVNPIEPPWYGPVCPVVWEGWRRGTSPYSDQSRFWQKTTALVARLTCRLDRNCGARDGLRVGVAR